MPASHLTKNGWEDNLRFSVEGRLVEKALQEAGLPVLSLESDYSEEDMAQLKTRIDAFMEIITA